MDRPAMRRGGADELEHRLGRVVVEDELVERVGIQRPAARFVGQRPLEHGSKVGVHRSGAVDVRVPREDEVDASILVGLEELSFHGQPDPSFHGMRFLGMVFRDEPGARTAVNVHVAGEHQSRARGFRGRECVVREERDGPRAAFFVAVLLAASAVGILTPTLSNTVTKDVQVTGFAVALTVDGIPDSVAPGDLIRVVAAMTNSANRPVPAILRMEVRNPNNTIPDEVTVYAGCGAEEVVSGTRLIYYIGWHGPLLAPKGISFAAGTSIATVSGSIGSAEYWATVLHEVQERDPAGYESLVEPGLNASLGVRNSGSSLLKTLNYYGMVASSNPASSNLADWTLTTVFSERFVAFGGPSQDGFLVEIHPQSRASFSVKLWAERPDALGIPHHPYTCGPL